jgi:HEAT repeat protein
MLEDTDSAVRIASITALQWLAPKPSLPVIARRCADPSPDVRRRAFSVLFEIGDAHQMGDHVLSEINTVIDRAAADPKAKATESLGETGRKSAWMILSRLLEDRETAVRSAAAAALVSLVVPESGPMIVLRLRTESDKWTRLHLLTSARELKLMDAVEPLIDWLRDPDPQIQNSALDALKRLTGMTMEIDPAAWADEWRNRKPVQ